MILVFFTLFMCVDAVEVVVNGDITFDIKINSHKESKSVSSEEENKAMKANDDEMSGKKSFRNTRERSRRVTAAAAVECVYQYPERQQVEAILSNMMNQLAKVYLRVQEYVDGVRRGDGSRFRVVPAPRSNDFDVIYANMTDEYRNLYSNTTDRVPRTADPCSSQSELKGIWSRLVDSSIIYLRNAVARSIDEFLKTKPMSRRKRYEVGQLVDRELSKVRSSQLDTLCDEFQLCYNELL